MVYCYRSVVSNLYTSKKRKYTNILTKEVLEKEYQELKSPKLIAEKYNVNIKTIRCYMDLLGIKRGLFRGSNGNNRQYEVNQSFFDTDTPESLYVAGFIAADGCISVTGHSFSISLKRSDKSHLQLIKNLINSTHNIVDVDRFDKRTNKTYYVSVLTIHSKSMVEALAERFNILPHKSLTLTFPKRLINSTLVHYFLLGYFDGDGHIGYSEESNYNEFRVKIVGTKSFLTDYYKILKNNTDLLKLLKVSTNNKKIKSNGDKIYRLTFTGNNVCYTIAKFLYNSKYYLDRKYHTFLILEQDRKYHKKP